MVSHPLLWIPCVSSPSICIALSAWVLKHIFGGATTTATASSGCVRLRLILCCSTTGALEPDAASRTGSSSALLASTTRKRVWPPGVSPNPQSILALHASECPTGLPRRLKASHPGQPMVYPRSRRSAFPIYTRFGPAIGSTSTTGGRLACSSGCGAATTLVRKGMEIFPPGTCGCSAEYFRRKATSPFHLILKCFLRIGKHFSTSPASSAMAWQLLADRGPR